MRLARYKRGERLRADDVNALIDAARDLPNIEALAAMGRNPASPWPIPYTYMGTEEVPPFGVLDVTGPATVANLLGVAARKIPEDDPPTSRPELKRRWLINGPTPTRASNGTPTSGWGSYLGTSNWVKHNGTASSFFSEWGPKPGTFEIWPDRGGFIPTGQVTNRYGGVFEAMQHPITHALGLPEVFAGYKEQHRCKVFVGPPGSETPSGFYVTGVYMAGRDIPIGEGVRIEWFNGHPYATPLFSQLTVVGKPLTTINKGFPGQVVVWDRFGSTGSQVTCLAWGAKCVANLFCVAWQEALTGQWYCGPWECPTI